VGVLAIIAAATAGTLNSAGSYNRRDVVQTECGLGHLPEFSAYVMAVAKKTIVAVRAVASTAGAYSAITKTGGGTSVITAGATEPVDDFSCVVEWTVGQTIGTTGAKYRYSIDGG
jgi:hypothetical protein